MEENNSTESVSSPENPIQTQPISPSVSKQNSLPIIMAILALLLLVGGGAYYLGTQSNKSANNTGAISEKTIYPTSSVIPHDTTTQVIHDFPLYAGSIFLKKEINPPCSQEHSGYSDCGTTAYMWGVNEDSEKVQKWYVKDTLDQLGWELKGGAGAGNLSTQTWKEKKRDFELVLQISAKATDETINPDYKTTIVVLLPTPESVDKLSKTVTSTPKYISPLVADATHKVYANSTYRYSFVYPIDFVIDSSSTTERISFLQKQDSLLAQRLLVTSYKNTGNVSLKDFAQAHDQSFSESRVTVGKSVRGYEMVSISKDLSNANCNDGRELVQRVESAYIKSQDTIVALTTNDTCETQNTDWFTPILSSFTF